VKIKFDYNNVDPNTVSEVLTHFMDEMKDFKIRDNGEEIGHLEFGSINLYLTLRSSVDNSSLGITNSKGEELVWTVKPHKMTKTNKTEVYSTENFSIYKNK